MAPLSSGRRMQIVPPVALNETVVETTQFFAQHGRRERGIHYSLQNTAMLGDVANREKDALQVMVVLHDETSWGPRRSVDDFFTLIESFMYPKAKTSLAMLTSSVSEFAAIQQRMRAHIGQYAQFALLFRDDFAFDRLTRGNRHGASIQAARRRMLARYRNFALLSTLEHWHQHVV